LGSTRRPWTRGSRLRSITSGLIAAEELGRWGVEVVVKRERGLVWVYWLELDSMKSDKMVPVVSSSVRFNGYSV